MMGSVAARPASAMPSVVPWRPTADPSAGYHGTIFEGKPQLGGPPTPSDPSAGYHGTLGGPIPEGRPMVTPWPPPVSMRPGPNVPQSMRPGPQSMRPGPQSMRPGPQDGAAAVGSMAAPSRASPAFQASGAPAPSRSGRGQMLPMTTPPSLRATPSPSFFEHSTSQQCPPSQSRSMAVPSSMGRDACRGASGKSSTGQSSASQSSTPARTASAEPQLLVVKLIYLSGLPIGGWFDRPPGYLISVHAGTEARADPPPKPGPYSSQVVQPGLPKAGNPEEQVIWQRVHQAIAEMQETDKPAPSHECRFNSRVAIRLSSVGPGPAAGGPAYFRIDVWAVRPSMFGKETHELFGRSFIPISQPELQRRPCTWPVEDVHGKDVAYLTCEFAFAHAPLAARSPSVDKATSSEVTLAWRPPRMDMLVPVWRYRIEACIVPKVDDDLLPVPGRDMFRDMPWRQVAQVEDTSVLIRELQGNCKYVFRIRAENEAGVGDPADVEALTGPVAPGLCGQPRLGRGCLGPVLTVEWDPPKDDGGAPIVAYWVRLRAAAGGPSASTSWFELGQVPHLDDGGPQRTEIHTEELNPNVSRYLCGVAAVNAAGDVGPSTPDASALPFPNAAVPYPPPDPLPQGQFLTASPFDAGHAMGLGFSSGRQPQDTLAGLPQFSMLDVQNDSFHPPLFSEDYDSQLQSFSDQNYQARLAALGSPMSMPGSSAPQGLLHEQFTDGYGVDNYGASPFVGDFDAAVSDAQAPFGVSPMSVAPEGVGSVADAESLQRMLPLPTDTVAFRKFGEEIPSPFGAGDRSFDLELQQRRLKAQEAVRVGFPDPEQQLRQRLEEKHLMYAASWQRYEQIRGRAALSPDDMAFATQMAEAQIEAESYKAEIAVLQLDLNTNGDAMNFERRG